MKELARILCKSSHVDTDFHTSILFREIIYLCIYTHTHKDIYYMCVWVGVFFPSDPLFIFSPFAITKGRDRNTSWVVPVQKHSHQTDCL